MSVLVVLGVGLLGGLGAVARFLVDGLVTRQAGPRFPFGILAVNLSGALALGVLAGAALQGDAYLLFGGGLLGAYTTFSTWMLDTRLLGEEGRRDLGVLNIVATLGLGLLAVWLGRQIGTAL